VSHDKAFKDPLNWWKINNFTFRTFKNYIHKWGNKSVEVIVLWV
jgi:hypothetical protein